MNCATLASPELSEAGHQKLNTLAEDKTNPPPSGGEIYVSTLLESAENKIQIIADAMPPSRYNHQFVLPSPIETTALKNK